MTAALENQEDTWPREPSSLTGRSICNVSGMQPREEGSCPTRYEYFIEGQIPSIENVSRQAIMVWKDTGRPASPKDVEENPDAIESREHTVMFDVVGDVVCLDCPPPAPPETSEG